MFNKRRLRIMKPPNRSFFLFGARGTGKSTWARQQFSDATRFDFLDERLFSQLTTNPGEFSQRLAALPPQSWVVMDEVQRMPHLLNDAHRAIEEQDLRFAILGSSTRKLMRAGVNLLGGRAARLTMPPFLPEELGDQFSLPRALEIGTIPLIWESEEPSSVLQDYVSLYLESEIRAEEAVRNLGRFARFLQVAGILHGQLLNTSTIARDVGAARGTVDGYLEILEQSLLTWRLPAYEARLRVRERSTPKIYWMDAGLARAARGDRGPVGQMEVGALLEGWVANLLRTYIQIDRFADELAYWASLDSKAEVDFLLRRKDEWMAIEVKSASRVDRTDLQGLRAIADLTKVRRRIVVARVDARQLTPEGIEILPVEQFHRELELKTLFPISLS